MHQQHPMAAGELGGTLVQRILQHRGLHLLALAVHRIQPLGHGGGLHRIGGEQQAQAQVRLGDAPAGIDARAEGKAHRIGRGLALDGGDCHQRRQPRPVAAGQHPQPLRDQRAVDAQQRHHIAHAGQCHHIEHIEQVRRGPLGEIPRLPQHPMRRHQRQKGHAGSAEMAQARMAIQPVGIDRG